MVLLFNVKIAAHRKCNDYRKGVINNFPISDRMDIFKYCLSSYSVFLPIISKCIFYIDISSEFLNRKDELEEFIYKLYPKENLTLHWYRNNTKSDWLNVCNVVEDINDEIIFLAGNDDHIFMDSSLDMIKRGIDVIRNDIDPMASFSFTHEPELIRVANHLNGELVDNGNFVKISFGNCDSLWVIKKPKFFKYWREMCPDNEIHFRPDGLCDSNYSPCIKNLVSNTYIPTKELVRHFDGYGHVNVSPNIIPPLSIPPGFFENEIKIKYGFKERDNGYVNLDPSNEFLFAYNNNGTDYRWCIDDIPLFWQDKINEIVRNGIDEDVMKEKRNMYFLLSMQNNITRCFNHSFNSEDKPPTKWFLNHLL